MSSDRDSYPLHVPVFPLSNAVLYPRMLLPLHIFEERYKLMVNEALAGDRRLAISLLRKGPEGGAAPSTVCGLGEIVEVQELDRGEKNILVRGVARIEIGQVPQEVPYLRARARVLYEVGGTDVGSVRRRRELAELAQQLLFLLDAKETMRLINLLSFMKDAGFLTDFVAFYLIEDCGLKQELLETLDVDERMQRVRAVLEEAVKSIEP